MKKYFIPLFFVLLSCGEHSFDDIFDDVTNKVFGTGLMPADNPDKYPQDIKNFSTSTLPPSVSLEDKFPPVQSQGGLGMCAVWSVGYAFKTALNAIEKNWTAADLAKPENQTDPYDLWMMISNKKNSDCNGVAMEYAMDALIATGAASMKDGKNNELKCSGINGIGDPNNKLANYRKIAYNNKLLVTASNWDIVGMEVDNFKSYLAQGRPIVFAGRLGDRFMDWDYGDESVLSTDYIKNFGRDWGKHGMVLVGYDDSRGTNGAFRVRNSWGDYWADKGSIWVGYDYFVKEFCLYAFVAQNPNYNPDNDNVKPPPSNTYDLLTKFAEDYQDPEAPKNPRARAFSYELFNNGSQKILASQNWGVYYMYYNAYDAEEYEIIFEDRYTDEYGKPCTKQGDVCWGKYENTSAIAGGLWNNMDIEPGKMAGEAEASDGFEIPYTMPSITGDYYLVVYADYENVIEESNEDNNLYFIAKPDGKPLEFENGVIKSEPMNSKVLAKRAKQAPVHSVVDLGELNAYTPKEIKTLLKRDKKNGILAKKAAKYRERKTNPIKRIKR